MRTIILLLIFAIIPTLTQARYRPAVATFRADGPFELRVSINGQPLNRRPSSVVKSHPLRPGRHTVAITAHDRRGRGKYGHHGHHGQRRGQTIYQTIVIRPGSNMLFAVRGGGRRGGLYVEADPWRYPERRDRFQDPIPYDHRPMCLDAQYFPVKRVVQEMRYRHHDWGKLQVAKDAMCNDLLMAEDLRRMMRHLDHDESRIELAVFAHDRVCDIDRFHTVFETFDRRRNAYEVKRRLGYI